MDGISRSRGWDKEIPHGVLPMEQPVLSDKRARIPRYMTSTRQCANQANVLSYSQYRQVLRLNRLLAWQDT